MYLNKIVIIFSCLLFCNSCLAANGSKVSNEEKPIVLERVPLKSVQDIDRYKNLTTAPSVIKLRFKDKETGKVINAVIGSDDLYYFIYKEKGPLEKEDYISYIKENLGKPLEANLNNLQKIFETGKSNRSRDYYKKNMVFDVPLNFEELGVKDEIGLINKYFDLYSEDAGTLKQEYYKNYNFNPAFIALLIDLGYEVEWRCWGGSMLTIYTKSAVEMLHYTGENIRDRDRWKKQKP